MLNSVLYALLPDGFEVDWTGGPLIEHLRIRFDDGRDEKRISSLFGHGVVAFNLPYLFRTPPGVNLWVKGPANSPKDGISALEGIVETDWTTASFTMNWKLTRPRTVVRFEPGEPICMVVPQPRGFLAALTPKRMPLASAPDVHEGYERWSRDRDDFQSRIAAGEPEACRAGWQKDYFKGQDPGTERFAGHQTNLHLKPFE